MSWLAVNCPRLARAREQRCVELGQERAERRKCRERLMRAENLVAHRQLQLLRAQAVGKRGYIDARDRKLKSAEKVLAYWQRRTGRAAA